MLHLGSDRVQSVGATGPITTLDRASSARASASLVSLNSLLPLGRSPKRPARASPRQINPQMGIRRRQPDNERDGSAAAAPIHDAEHAAVTKDRSVPVVNATVTP